MIPYGLTCIAVFAPRVLVTYLAQVGDVLLVVMVGAWFVSNAWLFHRLSTRHASIYESIGSPSLFWNRSPRSGLLFLKFLYYSDPRELDDRTAYRVISFLRILIVLYLVIFIVIILVVFIVVGALLISGGPRT